LKDIKKTFTHDSKLAESYTRSSNKTGVPCVVSTL
jgi:hypothetical protein